MGLLAITFSQSTFNTSDSMEFLNSELKLTHLFSFGVNRYISALWRGFRQGYGQQNLYPPKPFHFPNRYPIICTSAIPHICTSKKHARRTHPLNAQRRTPAVQTQKSDRGKGLYHQNGPGDSYRQNHNRY